MYEGAVQDLIDELGRLPGIGPKSAQRIAFHILDAEPEEVQKLATALVDAKSRVRFCEICGNVAQGVQCQICADPRRMDTVICVVEESKDVVAIERTREFRGKYHVLGGAIDPIGGIGPNNLRIRELLTRLQDDTVKEVILATDPNVEGEATATYIARLLSALPIRVTRLASGLPSAAIWNSRTRSPLVARLRAAPRWACDVVRAPRRSLLPCARLRRQVARGRGARIVGERAPVMRSPLQLGGRYRAINGTDSIPTRSELWH